MKRVFYTSMIPGGEYGKTKLTTVNATKMPASLRSHARLYCTEFYSCQA